jgi:hypothetical protein
MFFTAETERRREIPNAFTGYPTNLMQQIRIRKSFAFSLCVSASRARRAGGKKITTKALGHKVTRRACAGYLSDVAFLSALVSLWSITSYRPASEKCWHSSSASLRLEPEGQAVKKQIDRYALTRNNTGSHLFSNEERNLTFGRNHSCIVKN